MSVITRIDVLFVGLALIFTVDVIAILSTEDIGVIVTICGAIVTLVGYAFIRPVLVSECQLNEGV